MKQKAKTAFNIFSSILFGFMAVCAVLGLFIAVTNSHSLDSLPEDFSMAEKRKMIQKYDDNIKTVDSLKRRIKVLEDRITVNGKLDRRRAKKEKFIVIQDTLKIEQ